MSVTTGLTGDVASWAGTFNAAMLALLKPASFTANVSSQVLNTTGYAAGAAAVKAKIPGLQGWSGTIGGFLATPKTGILGTVATSGSEYVLNARSWSMDFAADVLGDDGSTTGFTQTDAGWMDKYPGLVTASGSFECMVDHSTAVTLTTAHGASLSTLTFTITTSQTLAASAIITVADVSSTVNAMNIIRFTYEVTGHVTISGSNNIIPSASTQVTPVAGSIVLKMSEQGATDKALTGNAFWNRIGISVAPNGVSPVDIGFTGTGALAPT